MKKLILYHTPGACSRVSLNALEEAGLEYEEQLVNVLTGEQHSGAYRQVNPRGKVPALTVDGQLITENAAIVLFLNELAPEAGLFPNAESSIDRSRHYSDLIWCSSTLHPAVRQLRVPVRFTTGDSSGVVERGLEYVEALFTVLEEHFRNHDFWYGDSWSILDVYLYWCYSTAVAGPEISLEPYAAIKQHSARVQSRKSYKRALQCELDAMDRAGMVLPGSMQLG